MIQLVKGDITKITDVEAIVNAANWLLLGGDGVDGAIHKAAGPKLRAECIKLHGCKPGNAKITGAYNLPCEYVIHTVGPVWKGGFFHEDEVLAKCYTNSLKVAKDNGIRRVAFSSISTGVFHYPLERAANVAITAVSSFIHDQPNCFELIEWVLFDDRTYNAYSSQLNIIRKRQTDNSITSARR